MKKKLLSLTLSLITFSLSAQTQFWSDNFEDVGSPSSGTRTPSVTFNASNERYFDRVTTAQINWTTVVSGVTGTKFWGGADIDNLSGQNTQTPHQNVIWSSINISGKTGLSFKGNFAIGNTANFDHFPGSSPIDYMIIEYRIDGGAWTNLVRFFPNIANNGSGALALETTGDSLAQGEGAALNGTFTEFSANIVGTGTILDLRLKCMVNGTSFEEVGADNFRLLYSSALPVTVSSFKSECEGGNEKISWVSQSEIRFNHYELEAAVGSEPFKTIAVILPLNETSEPHTYTYTYFGNVNNDQIYYRLKMVDDDGTVTWLTQISGNNCGRNHQSELLNSFVYNPNESLTLFLNQNNLTVELYSISGQQIFQTVSSEEQQISIPFELHHSDLFLIKLSNADLSKTELHKLYFNK